MEKRTVFTYRASMRTTQQEQSYLCSWVTHRIDHADGVQSLELRRKVKYMSRLLFK